MIVSYDLSSSDLIGSMSNGVIGQVPPGSNNAMTSSYSIRYLPSQGVNDSLLYDLSGKNRNATINGGIVVNGRTITSTLTPATAWSGLGITLGSATGALPVLDPVLLNEYRPDQGDSLLLFTKMYIPSIPATGSTKTIFGAQGTNASFQNNGIRFAIECQDHALPGTISLITYDGVGGSRFSGASTGVVTASTDNCLAWYLEGSTAKVKLYVNNVASSAGVNQFYLRNFYTDILTSTTANTPPFGIGGGAKDLSVGIPNAVIKQFDLVIIKGRGLSDPDKLVSKLTNFPGIPVSEGDIK